MRNGCSKGTCRGTLGVDVDPLLITGCRGERVDSRLIDRDPFADAQQTTNPAGKFFESIYVGGAQALPASGSSQTLDANSIRPDKHEWRPEKRLAIASTKTPASKVAFCCRQRRRG